MKITKIIIKGCSGYCPENEAYEDRVIIAPESISYKFQSLSDDEKTIKWRYRSDSKAFADWYEEVCQGVEEQLASEMGCICTDVGGVDFKVIYEDKSRRHKHFCVSTVYFGDLFRLIKKMVPAGEEVPCVLETVEDYADRYEIEKGRYRHFKGKEYEVLGMARNSETEQEMVVYKALYGDRDVWVRPAAMWEETLHRNGKVFQRFSRIEEDE